MPTTPQTPTMADRIADAERALQPLRLAVNTLASRKRSAIDQGDFAAAQTAQDALPAAREEAAAAQALVDSLRAASAEIARQRDIEAAEIQLAERTAEARQALGTHQQAENAALAEARQELERARDLARQARAAVLSALAAERAADQARQAVQSCVSLIENRPAHRVAAPRSVQAATEQDQLIVALMRLAG
jgi:hypothetical protein